MSAASRWSVPVAAALLAGLLWAGDAGAQAPRVPPSDYGRFERLGAFALDPTGAWLVSSIQRVDEHVELRLRPTIGGDPLVLAHGAAPVFSRDGLWLAYRKGASPEERERAEERLPDRLGLVDLRARSDTVLFPVTSFAFRDDGAWLAARSVPASDSVGADLVVLNPGTGVRTVIGNVDAFHWQDEGRLLAATLRTGSGAPNGVVLFDPDASVLRTLDSGDAEYRALTWRDESPQLAVLRARSREGGGEASHDVLVWNDVRAGAPRVLDGSGQEWADRLRIAEHAGIRFSADGSSLFFGVRPWERRGRTGDRTDTSNANGERAPEEADRPKTQDGAEPDQGSEVADVQVWHWNDDLILRAQEYRRDQIARQTLATVWHVRDDRVVVLGDELDEPVQIAAGGRWGLVPDYDPYLFERRFGDGAADWYRVDVRSGERTLVAERARFGVESSFDEARALVYRNDRWTAFDLASLEAVEIGEGRSFTQPLDAYDYPGPRPSWGFGGWIEDDRGVLLYDEHDVWRADTQSGTIERLTRGAEQGTRYRVVDLDPDRRPGGRPSLGPDERVWLSVHELRTKRSGYARLGEAGGVETLLIEDARVRALERARDAERLAVRIERWDDSPDVFVGNGDLSGLVRVTRTNPFLGEYAWGRAELLDYTTAAGHDLQAILVYPSGFREGERYPLILYQYERLSDNLHTFDVPSERDYYNYQAWSQAGYFVLMPDIVYEPGRPGPSALDAVEHALDAALATGHVDPDAMGLIGHSWGGYQAAYLPTRTDRFAASVAGAAITNFMSFMGAVHWNGGLPETGHWETGQARMAVPYWEDLEGHLESSPAHFITELSTPMLLMHGDADGVVDFYQGLEFYNYARRAGKEVVLLVYPGADHGLSEKSQQVDYHRRILAWFGHHLKGEPAPRWITDGETWVERDRRIGK